MNRIIYDDSGELWVSDIDAVQTEAVEQFDRIVTVCQDRVDDVVLDEQTYYHFHMCDGPDDELGGDYSYEIFERAADTVYRELSNDHTVLLHCHLGQSRSVSVGTAALGRLLDIPRHEAFSTVEQYRPQADPEPVMMEHVDRYISQYYNSS